MRVKVTFVHTIDTDGVIMVCPACEQWRHPDFATEAVMRREYEKGIATWLTHATVGEFFLSAINPIYSVY